MILVSAPYPDQSNERNGMVRRVASVDAALAHVDRLYLTVRAAPPGTWPPAAPRQVAPLARQLEVNLLEPADAASFLRLASEAVLLLAHSVHWAEPVLSLYGLLPTVTDLHGAVPEECEMLGSQEAAARFARVESHVLKSSTHVLCVSRAMAAHFQAKYPSARPEYVEWPIDGGAPVDATALDRPGPLRAVYSGGADVWQNLPALAQAIAARPDVEVELLSPARDELQRALDAAGARATVRSVAPGEVAATYARCHLGFVLRDDHVVNRVASPTKLQEYLAHGVVPVVDSPAIGDFAALGYRHVAVEDYRAGRLPDLDGWRAMALHNLEVARAQRMRAEAGRRRLLAVVEDAHRRGPPPGVREGLSGLEHLLRLAGHALALERGRQAAPPPRQTAPDDEQRALDALSDEVEALRHEARVARRAGRAAASPSPESRRAPATVEEVLASRPGAPVIATRPLLDWDWPMQQRPHHLARALAKEGFLSFFVTPNGRDGVTAVRRLDQGCYLTADAGALARSPRWPRWLHVYSTDGDCTVETIEAARAAGYLILYDVIDALHADVAGRPITEAMRRRHRVLLRHADAVVASSHALLDEVRAVRVGPTALVGNGVDVRHFDGVRPAHPPAPLAAVLARGQPVLGYTGALARWFDYALVRQVALARPQVQVVLVGQDYDGSLAASGVASLPNVTVYGPVPYAELPGHTAFFDVAMVPFLVNEVTQATSPLKLFEYLAQGKAVLTTPLRECRLSATARLAADAPSFVEQLDEALAARHVPAVARAARAEAVAHDWVRKASVLAGLLGSLAPSSIFTPCQVFVPHAVSGD